MADIPGELDKLNDDEVSFEASLSEALLNKMAANINELIDLNTTTIFTSGGTYEIPLNATRILVGACGGGGGGASGGVAGFGQAINSQGGYGSMLTLQTIEVTGGETATIVIGAGGAGGAATGATAGNNGFNGGNTTFSNPSNGTHTWYGGKGGVAPNADGFNINENLFANAPYNTTGGFSTTNGSPGFELYNGQSGLWAGGTTKGFGGGGRGGGGGGGAGSFGVGADGGDPVFTSIPSPAGNDAAALAYGSGGGASAIGVTGSGKGGDGAQGFFFILRTFS